jgi:NADH-quinone oxidoreductase subunit E
MGETKFTFNSENKKLAKAAVANYPKGRQKSAVMALLDLAQRQNAGWLSREVMDYIAEYLEMAPIRVYEVASFYTMYNLKPVGKFLVQVCTTTPCALRGAEEILKACKTQLGVELDEMTADEFFTIKEVECLGACVNAPVVQINDDYYEDLAPARIKEILTLLKDGRKVKSGSQIDRKSSEPFEGEL